MHLWEVAEKFSAKPRKEWPRAMKCSYSSMYSSTHLAYCFWSFFKPSQRNFTIFLLCHFFLGWVNNFYSSPHIYFSNFVQWSFVFDQTWIVHTHTHTHIYIYIYIYIYNLENEIFYNSLMVNRMYWVNFGKESLFFKSERATNVYIVQELRLLYFCFWLLMVW